MLTQIFGVFSTAQRGVFPFHSPCSQTPVGGHHDTGDLANPQDEFTHQTRMGEWGGSGSGVKPLTKLSKHR